MTRYAQYNDDEGLAKARGERVRVHYKKTREICHFIKGMYVTKAIKYLEKVIEGTRGIPMLRHTGGCGRHGSGKLLKTPGNVVSFPIKPTKKVIELLKNTLANAKALNADLTDEDLNKVKIIHIQTNRAVKSRRRLYRAHGRIAPFMLSPVHIEIVARVVDPETEQVEKAEPAPKKALSRKQVAKLRFKLRNGASA
mmetsp:Transcript_48050/g.73170  ORF Transcript_48050/g.73170 Transcript_48050/m.73170 type:complete len:196 (+) Transcript_48050:9-596(+)|eukprot:CAMPEP_0117054974 /NCGR_PEP_ID=MMETSP0472-20121206/38098_1 /TAXON_ID=693140 ORGANISM="Tiarina fusus, Strain LIS" /NCGR_SAMPLE_ID=MMETSP0472 /ASSEMBLY_ACC=CAM_ASM_000603 /LENGTH=195 /DNA_ID=CAMNT_0004770767 /DNA_START=9 /DNA_END=596 /DNA_ORIENTATION=-